MSFPTYPAYIDVGVDWLGKIPAHWQQKWLGLLAAESRTSFVDGPFGSDLKSSDYQDEGIPLIQLNNIRDGQHVLRNMKFISEEKRNELSRHSVFPGDVVIAKMADPVARSAIVSEEFSEYVIVADCVKMTPNLASVDLGFLIWAVNSDCVRISAELMSSGVTRIRINLGQVKKLKIPYPPLCEQAQIARFLDHETARIDALIEEQQRLIELLKEKRQAVISHAVTKGLDPTVPMKDSGVEWLGEVPAHWEVTKFKWLLRTASGGTPPSSDRETYYDGGIPWLRSLDLTDDLVTEYEVTVTQRAVEETACKIVPKSSVLIAMYGGDGTIGKNGLLTFDSAINQAICAFLPSDRCTPEYLHRYIQFYRPYWMIGAESSRKDPNIGQDRIGDHFLVLPPPQEQSEIVAFLGVELLKFSALVKEAQTGVELLQERRSALISAAVTGKIDVRNWQPPARAQAPECEEVEAV